MSSTARYRRFRITMARSASSGTTACGAMRSTLRYGSADLAEGSTASYYAGTVAVIRDKCPHLVACA